jgi:hypothetical protein
LGSRRELLRTTTAEWDRISAEKESLVTFLLQDAEHFPEFPHGTINVWPFYVVPKLEN